MYIEIIKTLPPFLDFPDLKLNVFKYSVGTISKSDILIEENETYVLLQSTLPSGIFNIHIYRQTQLLNIEWM